MYVLQLVITGLQQGGIIALLAVGLSLMFGVLRLVNFAQADFMMLGMYGVVTLSTLASVNFALLAALLAIPGFALGWLIYRFVIRQVGKTKLGAAPEHAQLLATLGLSLILQNLAQAIWGATPLSLPGTQTLDVWNIGPLVIDKPRTVAFVVAIVVVAIMLVVLRRTHIGRSVRAAASDAEAASYAGINVRRAYSVTFAVSIALSVVAGGILVSYYPVDPQTGSDFILLMFTAIILGGLRSVVGALVGGLIIGLVQALSQIIIPLQLNEAVVFALFLLIMLFRPAGLFGEVTRL